MKIHHIGYLVKKLDKALKTFQGLGFTVSQNKVTDASRGVDIVFISKDGYTIELVSPITTESVVAEVIKKLGNNAYHICYETESLESAIAQLREERYVVCSEPLVAPACGGHRVAFLIHPFMGMIELVETK